METRTIERKDYNEWNRNRTCRRRHSWPYPRLDRSDIILAVLCHLGIEYTVWVRNCVHFQDLGLGAGFVCDGKGIG